MNLNPLVVDIQRAEETYMFLMENIKQQNIEQQMQAGIPEWDRDMTCMALKAQFKNFTDGDVEDVMFYAELTNNK